MRELKWNFKEFFRKLNKKGKWKREAVICLLLSFALSLTYVTWNVFASSEPQYDFGTNQEAVMATFTYDDVTYDPQDAKYIWDVSENNDRKIMAYYFKDGLLENKYGDGTVVLRDVNPSLDANEPNRLMTFDEINENSAKDKYQDYDSIRSLPDTIPTPWASLECSNNGYLVTKFIVANDVHIGENMKYYFSLLSHCTYYDLTNLKVDFDYLIENNNYNRIKDTFTSGLDSAITIKMFNNSGYLPSWMSSYFGRLNVIFDFSKVDMDFDSNNRLTAEGEQDGMWVGENVIEIMIPRTIKNAPDKVYFNQYFESLDFEIARWYVYDSNDNLLGVTDHLVDQEDTYNEFEGTPHHMKPAPELSFYHYYDLYVKADWDEEKELEIVNNAGGWFELSLELDDITNISIDDDSFFGKTNYENFVNDLWDIGPTFVEKMFDYIKEYLINNSSDGSYRIPTDIVPDFEYNKTSDTNTNMYHLAYLGLNEFIKRIYNIELDNDFTGSYDYLDEVSVKVKDVEGTALDKGYKLFFANRGYGDISYYALGDNEYEEKLNSSTINKLSTWGGAIVSSDDDNYYFTYTLDKDTEKNIEDSSYLSFKYTSNSNVKPEVKITLNNITRTSELFTIQAIGGNARGVYIYNIDEIIDSDFLIPQLRTDGNYNYLFSVIWNDLDDNESATIKITLPKKGNVLFNRYNITENKTGRVNPLSFEDYIELDNYYVCLSDYCGSGYPSMLVDNGISKVKMYYTGPSILFFDGAISNFKIFEDSTPIDSSNLDIHTEFTNSNIEDWISSESFREVNIRTIYMSGLTGIFFGTNGRKYIFIIPKEIPYEFYKEDSCFDVTFESIGNTMGTIFYKGFDESYNPGIKEFGPVVISPFSIAKPSSGTDKVKLKVNGSDVTGTAALNTNSSGEITDDIKLYKKNNKNNWVEIPTDDYTISYSSSSETSGTLTITSKENPITRTTNITGSRSYAYTVGGGSTPGGGGSSGGGGGGATPTYKITNVSDSVKEISKSSQSGSKITVYPFTNRKVSEVLVTDKKGNKIEVTQTSESTFTFKMPSSDVTVEVKYEEREILLFINKLVAYVDKTEKELDTTPILRNDRTMLPIRFVAENLDAEVTWDEEGRTATITEGETKIVITIGSNKVLVNDKEYELDVVPFIENDRTYLPVRFVSEHLNAKVDWYEPEKKVTITKE